MAKFVQASDWTVGMRIKPDRHVLKITYLLVTDEMSTARVDAYMPGAERPFYTTMINSLPDKLWPLAD